MDEIVWAVPPPSKNDTLSESADYQAYYAEDFQRQTGITNVLGMSPGSPLKKAKTMQAPIKIVVVEDEKRIRENLIQEINREPGLCCINNYHSAEDALAGILEDRPDVVVIDVYLPGMDGIRCVRQLRAALPHVRCLILTNCEETEKIFSSFFAGASGYLLKRNSNAQLLEAIRQVENGGSPMSNSVARKVVAYFNDLGENKPTTTFFSPRERQVLELLVKGVAYKGIADQLLLSIETVRMHIKRIYAKLHVHSRGEAVAKYLMHKPNRLSLF